MKKILRILSFVLVVLLVAGSWWLIRIRKESGEPLASPSKETSVSSPSEDDAANGGRNPTAILKTSQGDIQIELFMDRAPITAGNFLALAKKGFYDKTKFHRVISGFIIQGGDPNSKGSEISTYGLGGPGYTIEDEFISGLSNVRGTISMANTGQPNSGGSQFFINLRDNTGLDFDKPPLTSRHPVFGRVVHGMDVVDKISRVKTDPRDVPLEPIILTSVLIEE